MRWVRRIEILSGVVSIAAALALWSEGAWHWVLLGSGLLALSPWPGPGALVRKAEQKPEILNSDRERGRRRARTFFKILVPSQSLLFGLFGYLTLGVGGAVFMVLMGLLSAAFGFWMYLKIRSQVASPPITLSCMDRSSAGRQPPGVRRTVRGKVERSVRPLNWFLLRVPLVFSPLALIAGLAALVQGWAAPGALFLLMAAVMAAAGWRTRGQRQPPA